MFTAAIAGRETPATPSALPLTIMPEYTALIPSNKKSAQKSIDQSARLFETATKLKADVSGEMFERAFKKVTEKPAPTGPKPTRA
jgi:hypothetical protein